MTNKELAKLIHKNGWKQARGYLFYDKLGQELSFSTPKAELKKLTYSACAIGQAYLNSDFKTFHAFQNSFPMKIYNFIWIENDCRMQSLKKIASKVEAIPDVQG